MHDPDDPVGRLLFNVLAMIAEFESDLIRMRTREGMKVARAKGRLRGKQPKLKPAQEAHLVELWRAGQHTSAELAEHRTRMRNNVQQPPVRAENPIRGCEQRSCDVGDPAVMITDHVPAVRLPPDH